MYVVESSSLEYMCSYPTMIQKKNAAHLIKSVHLSPNLVGALPITKTKVQ